ncbi:hypothetical protein FA10DRAFT_40836 [Acaromyces ingoldii]|uniref:Uncharacterized protein n=1 Tax=Acaromyces ingoldii TaxID=215250 RepID=A0A316YX90_9BASI|nr:hypothetical protein FA10DRAFT_40836 [Acaromyces ingoldii]PWN94067.1 hypothetical protein FA10DRAFT_40836 [Acaromyces ingoldii]
MFSSCFLREKITSMAVSTLCKPRGRCVSVVVTLSLRLASLSGRGVGASPRLLSGTRLSLRRCLDKDIRTVLLPSLDLFSQHHTEANKANGRAFLHQRWVAAISLEG